MSIYATLWKLKFPRYGDAFFSCEWIEVTAQGVPAHIGSPTETYGDGEDLFADFLRRRSNWMSTESTHTCAPSCS